MQFKGTTCHSLPQNSAHLDREDVCCMPCMHRKELLLVQGIPHNAVLIIRARGQQAKKSKEIKLYKLAGAVITRPPSQWQVTFYRN